MVRPCWVDHSPLDLTAVGGHRYYPHVNCPERPLALVVVETLDQQVGGFPQQLESLDCFVGDQAEIHGTREWPPAEVLLELGHVAVKGNVVATLTQPLGHPSPDLAGHFVEDVEQVIVGLPKHLASLVPDLDDQPFPALALLDEVPVLQLFHPAADCLLAYAKLVRQLGCGEGCGRLKSSLLPQHDQ